VPLTSRGCREVAAWAATLPRTGGPALSVGERLGRIGAAFPALAADLRPAQERARAVAAAIPAVLEHGDLWAGNLLAADGRLTGVVDWDNWHPAGVPGADLLHVIAMTRRAETRQELGELWLERPWAGARFRDATADYWDRLGLELTDELAWLVGVSWWAAHVTAGLRRGRQPASDPAWVARNVENVAPRLAAIS
jgi:aminoglycoside phosphotransferase (APT) family kinase protein